MIVFVRFGGSMASESQPPRSHESLLKLLDLGQALVLDLDGRIVHWTSGSQRLYGYSPSEAVGRISHELLHTRFPQPLAEIRAQLDQDGHWEGELVHRHRDGHAVTVASLWVLERDASGKPVAILEANNDITGLKRAEEVVREIEAATFENTAVGITHTDREGRWQRVNRKLCQTLGYTKEELVGRYFADFTHPEDREEDLRQYARMMRGECDSYTIEERYIRKDGRPLWVRVLRSAQPASGDRPTYAISVSVIEDIAARKQAEEALNESHQRLAGIIDSAMDGIITADENQRIVLFNPAAEKMFGCPADQAIGSPIDRFIPDRFRAVHAQHIRHFGQTGTSARAMGHLGAISGLRTNGEEFPIEASISQVSVGGHKLYSVILRDITERQRAEEAMAAARLSAERANQAKDRFMAVLSHELRNPLTPVLATAALLQEDERLEQETRNHIEVIRRNAELEARLIDDLLDVTRIARGKVELNRRPIQICTVLQHAVEVCQPDIEERRLHFGLTIKDPPHIIYADAGRLQQVFWNLIKNSVKFTPHHGCVGVRCWREDSQAVVEVSDSGVGIEPEALARIFTAFEQEERSTTRQFGGLGLGLAISKALIEMHGGTISACSEGKGRGATFTVRLPIASSSAHPAPSAPETAPGSELPTVAASRQGQRRAPLRILLVEDHGDTARIMTRLLARQGHEVETAGDLATAMDLAEHSSFDLLLSDLGLPDGSGLDLLQMLRQRGYTFPAIALSGYGQEQDVQQSLAAGFGLHLTKPVDLTRLEEAVAALTAASFPGEK